MAKGQVTADWFQKNIPQDVAKQQADSLNISTDQLYKLYANYQNQTGQPILNQPTQKAGLGLAATYTPQLGPSAGKTSTLAPITQIMGPSAAWQSIQPPPQQQQPQYQTPQLGPAQPMPTVQTQVLTPRGPYGGVGTAGMTAPIQPASAASAQSTAPLFNPSTSQPYMTSMQATPGIQPLQPGQIQPQPQQFQTGGLVQNQQQQKTPFQIDPSINPQLMGYGDPSAMSGWYNPENLASALGAQVLGSAMITGPTPSGTPSSKSGVAQVGGSQVWQQPFGTTSPGKSYYQLSNGTMLDPSQLGPADIAELQKGVGLGTVKYTMAQTAQGGPQGPWNVVPGLFKQAPLYQLPDSTQQFLTARTPANAAQMPQAGPMPTYAPQTAAPMPAQFNYGNVAGSQYAPPPAPGASVPPTGAFGPPPAPVPAQINQQVASIQQSHMSGLANAGMAIYAHFGGDPSSATPDDIANFHNQLQGRIANAFPVNQPPLSASAASSTVPAPVKRREGGPIPGRGSTDTVPAMLTPGEFVMNKDAVKDIGVGNLQAMNRQHFADGGPVPYPYTSMVYEETKPYSPFNPRPSQPNREVPTPMSGSQQGGQQPAPAVGSGTPATGSNYWDQRGLVGTSPGPGESGYIYEPSYPAGTTQGPAGPGYANRLTVGDVAGGAAVPGAGVTESLGKFTGPGSGQPTHDALSTIGSGLAAAGKAYADSVKPWHIQQNAIGMFGNPVASNQQPVTLRQETLT